mmetsp:Transcript_16680/g.42674  ORF Transcript_16680/g.42674 Transcript_16680/m.42674 type:complete len:223 (+) Transcript_16680:961-1629(+)
MDDSMPSFQASSAAPAWSPACRYKEFRSSRALSASAKASIEEGDDDEADAAEDAVIDPPSSTAALNDAARMRRATGRDASRPKNSTSFTSLSALRLSSARQLATSRPSPNFSASSRAALLDPVASSSGTRSRHRGTSFSSDAANAGLPCSRHAAAAPTNGCATRASDDAERHPSNFCSTASSASPWLVSSTRRLQFTSTCRSVPRRARSTWQPAAASACMSR